MSIKYFLRLTLFGNRPICHSEYKINQQQIRVLEDRAKNQKVIINHFEANRCITTKTGLIKSLKLYYKSQDLAFQNVLIFYKNYNTWSSTPPTYLLTAGVEDKQHYNFQKKFNDLDRQNFYRDHLQPNQCKNNIWILKPAGMNQGKGIEIFRTIKQFTSIFALKSCNSMWVVQKYLQKPLLFKNRKFDIRQWVVVTPNLQIFFFKKAYIRTSGELYNLQTNEVSVHLTNNSLQKNLPSYNFYQEGNTLSFDVLIEEEPNFPVDHVIQRMKDLIIDTILAAKQRLITRKSICQSKRKQFELFGYDFLIDQNYRVWLLQVNSNPSLGVSNQFSEQILNLMMKGLMMIILHPNATQYDNYELIQSEASTLYSKQPIHKRSSFKQCLYPFGPPNPPYKKNNCPYFKKLNRPNIKRNIKTQAIDQQKNQIIEEKFNQQDRKQGQKDKPEENQNQFDQEDRQTKQTSLKVQKGGSGENNEMVYEKKTKQKRKYQQGLDIQIKKLLLTNSLCQQFHKPLNLLISKLTNWQLLSQKQLNKYYSILQLLSKSKVISLLLQDKYSGRILDIIQGSTYPIRMQQLFLRSFILLAKYPLFRGKLLPLTKLLLRLSNQLEDNDPLLTCIYQLSSPLLSLFQKSQYIPGQTAVDSKHKQYILKEGILKDILILQKKLKQDNFQKMDIDIVELQRMNQILQLDQLKGKIESLRISINKNIAFQKERVSKANRQQQQIKRRIQQQQIRRKQQVAMYMKRKHQQRKQIKVKQEIRIMEIKDIEEQRKKRMFQELQRNRFKNKTLQKNKEKQKEKERQRIESQAREIQQWKKQRLIVLQQKRDKYNQRKLNKSVNKMITKPTYERQQLLNEMEEELNQVKVKSLKNYHPKFNQDCLASKLQKYMRTVMTAQKNVILNLVKKSPYNNKLI